MRTSSASWQSLVGAICIVSGPFVLVPGCSSESPPAESVSSTSSAYVVGGCECIEEGSCGNESFGDQPSDGDYYITTFTGGGMACGGEATGDWAYVADEGRFGCGAKVEVTANGKSCIALVSDCGPNKCVEEAAAGSCDAHHPILDSSPFITQYLFDISSSGWSNHRTVTVKEASASATVGCPGSSGGGSSGAGGGTATTCAAGTAAVARGEQWVDANLHYCQAAYGRVDGDGACWGWEGPDHVCDRESNGAWNDYRSDCSGFVTFAWGLPPVGDGGYTTGDFAPYSSDLSKVIPGEALQPGDACNKNVTSSSDGHILLFVKWMTTGSEAEFYEEPGCSADPPYAHSFTSHVELSGSNITVDYEGATFTAIRSNGNGCSGGGSSGGSGGGSTSSCYSETLGREVPNNACVKSKSDGIVYECDDGTWVFPAAGQAMCSATYGEGTASSQGCHSETLGREVPDNACVQSDINSEWYQCANGNWADRWTDPTACNGVYPLSGRTDNSGKGCHSDTLDCNMPDNACVESEFGDDWYQCDDGAWTD